MHKFVSGKVLAGSFVVLAAVLGALFIIGTYGEDQIRGSAAEDYSIDIARLGQKKPFVERVASAVSRVFNESPNKEPDNFTQRFAGFVSSDLLAKNPESLAGLDTSVLSSFFSKIGLEAPPQPSITEDDLHIIDDSSMAAFKKYRESFQALKDTYNKNLEGVESPSLLVQQMDPDTLQQLAGIYGRFVSEALKIPVPKEWAPVFLEEITFLDAKRNAYDLAATKFQTDPVAVALAFQPLEQRGAELAEAERILDDQLEAIQLGRLAELEQLLRTQFNQTP